MPRERPRTLKFTATMSYENGRRVSLRVVCPTKQNWFPRTYGHCMFKLFPKRAPKPLPKAGR